MFKAVQGGGVVTYEGDRGITEANSEAGGSVSSEQFGLLLGCNKRWGGDNTAPKKWGEEADLVTVADAGSVHTNDGGC